MHTVITSAITKIIIQRGIAKKLIEDTEWSVENFYSNPKQRQEKRNKEQK